jgi:hypothetical protein
MYSCQAHDIARGRYMPLVFVCARGDASSRTRLRFRRVEGGFVSLDLLAITDATQKLRTLAGQHYLRILFALLATAEPDAG